MIVRAVRARWPERHDRVVIELALDEAEDLAHAIQRAWPAPDLAFADGEEILKAVRSLQAEEEEETS